MGPRRLDRLNSLLKEVISDVIRKDIKNPHLTSLITITDVEITKDLQHAKVFVSVIGTKEEKKQTLLILQSASSFIRVSASKQVVMRYFPDLVFHLDESVEKQMHIEDIISKIQKERNEREQHEA
jgi:ribosome-binding factor A